MQIGVAGASRMLAVMLICSLWEYTNGVLCSIARQRCLSKMGCGHALTRLLLDCHYVFDRSGNSTQCHDKCKHILVSLLATDTNGGKDFINCDCEGDRQCESRKDRIKVCAGGVFDSLKLVKDDTSVLNCTLALLVCKADTACNTAFKHYLQACPQLIATQAAVCTESCRQSVELLYHQRYAKKLEHCQCDHSNVYCPVKDRIDRLCYNKKQATRESKSYRVGYRYDTTSTYTHTQTNAQTNSPAQCQIVFNLYVIILILITNLLMGR